jgi:isoleucyl-tRNA synthetase
MIQNKDSTQAVLCGPPFSNGRPHIGHGVNLVTKDFISRYFEKFDQKKNEFRLIMDCQGLPIEHEIRAKYGADLDSKSFLQKCEKFSIQNIKPFQNLVSKLRVNTHKDTFSTLDVGYKVALMNAISDLYQRGYVKQKLTHVDYCARCKSVLANAQIEQKSQKKSVYVCEAVLQGCKSVLLFATTKPYSVWTNTHIALKRQKKYYGLLKNGVTYITAKINAIPDAQIVKQYTSESLENLSYTIYSTQNNVMSQGKIVLSDMVLDDTEEKVLGQIAGVHLSSFTSQKDFKELNRLNYELKPKDIEYYKQLLDKKTTAEELPRHLFKTEYVNQNEIDHCWKCKKQTQNILSAQYYIVIPESVRERMVQDLKKVQFNNESYRKPCENFFKEPVDWCITRDKPFGTPLPLLRCKNYECKVQTHKFNTSDFEKVFVKDLSEVVKRKKLKCKYCDSELQVLGSTLDVWLDSGFLSSYFGKEYECFIEGRDQIRGWFYASAVLSQMINQKLPYKGLVFMGWITDVNRNKLSKSSKNYKDIFEVLDAVGIDEFRSYSLSRANSKIAPFSEELVQKEKKITNCISNIYRYITSDMFSQTKIVPLLKLGKKIEQLQDTQCSYGLKEKYSEVVKVLQKLDQNIDLLQYSSYWDRLKTFILKKYSQGYINELKHVTKKDPLVKCFIKNVGKILLDKVEPVLAKEFLLT